MSHPVQGMIDPVLATTPDTHMISLGKQGTGLVEKYEKGELYTGNLGEREMLENHIYMVD